jgi:GTPase SAR1 family protein
MKEIISSTLEKDSKREEGLMKYTYRYLRFNLQDALEHIPVLITGLSLPGFKLPSLPTKLERLVHLRTLNLQRNKLTEDCIGRWIASLSQLEKLDLGGNELKKIPSSIGSLTSLRDLSLYYNQILVNSNDLPLFLDNLTNLQSLDLRRNPTRTNPEILRMDPNQVTSLLRQLRLGKRRVFRERIMVVGCQEAGKTSLIFRLTHPNQSAPIIEQDKRTFGVVTRRWKESDIQVVKNVKGEGGTTDRERNKLEVEFWDFAGQTVFYPTHHMFLDSNVVYLVVFSWIYSRGTKVAPLVKEWILRIRSRGVKEPILLVGTHKDQVGNRLTSLQRQLREDLKETKDELVSDEKKIVIINVSNNNSSEEASGMNLLKKWIAKIAETRSREGGHELGEEYPESYLKVEDRIMHHLNNLQKGPSLDIEAFEGAELTHSESTFVTVEQFQRHFTAGMAREDVLAMLSFFHFSGTVLWKTPAPRTSDHQVRPQERNRERYLQKEYSDMVFLDPQWLMRELISLVNYFVDDHNLHHRAGIVELTELRGHYAHLPSSLFDHVPEILIRFELAIPLEEDQFFIPLRLQDWDETNTNDGKFDPEATKKYQVALDYVPDGMMALFFFRLHLLAPQSLFRRNKCILLHSKESMKCWIEIEGKRIHFHCSLLSVRFCEEVFQVMVKLVKERFSGLSLFGVLEKNQRTLPLDYFKQLKSYRKNTEVIKVSGEEFRYSDILPQQLQSSSREEIELRDEAWNNNVEQPQRVRNTLIDPTIESKPVRLGKSAEDPGLWKFATNLQANPEKVNAFKAKFQQFWAGFAVAVNYNIQQLRKSFPELQEWKCDEVRELIVGSLGNLTHLNHFDIDVYVVLNTEPLKFEARGNIAFWRRDKQLQPAHVIAITDAFFQAVDDFSNAQDEDVFTLKQHGKTGMCYFTFTTTTARDGVLEFDILPALRIVDGSYLILCTDGSFRRFNTNVVVTTIKNLAETHKGLREMMKVLKLIAKSKSGAIATKLLPSCVWEAAVLKVAEEFGERKWMADTFTNIFCACLSIIEKGLTQNIALPACNNLRDDLLSCVRSDKPTKAVLKAFLDGWTAVPPKQLLERLQAAVQSFEEGT